MKRKILSLILVFAMTVSLLTVGTGAVEPTYGDTAGHWAESSIERWSAYGIIQGSNGQFDPNGQLTCAQLATILAKLLKLPAAKDAGFTDNTADAWYYDAINRCAAAGILNGNGDGTVTPEAPITRERAMVMLARALGIEPIRKPDLTKYTDAAQVSAYAQGYVAALIEAGIVGGVTADELAPQDNINRASTVTILDRAISTYADQAGATVKVDGKGIVLVVAENVKITGAPEGTKIVVADGATGLTVNGKAVSDDQTYIVPKTTSSGSSSGGYSHSHSYDATSHKCSCGEFAPDVVATIGNTNGYLTLEAAVAAAQSGDIVKLVKDANMTDTIHIKDGKEITLALNTHNVSITEQGKFIRVCNAELTVTGPGAVKEMHPYYSPILIKGGPAGSANYSVVNVGSGVTLEGWAGVFIDNNDGNNYGIVLNVNDATLKGVDDVSGASGSAVYVNGSITNENNMPKITLNNATLKATGAGMYLAGYADTTISGGSVEGTATAIEIRAGKLTLNGGSYAASAETYSCDPNGNGATTSGAALAIAQHTTKKNINVMISGGTFTGVKALSESNPQANDPAPEVTLSITDGTFNGDVTIADKDHTSIAGGTFSTKPDDSYIAAGYEAKNNDNGTWTVREKTGVTLVAQVGVNKYASLADALAAAKDGDTVKLVSNITTDEGIAVAKKVTLDMANHTITSAVKQVFTVLDAGDLTITGNGKITGPTGEAAKNFDSYSMIYVTGTNAKLTVMDGTITAGGVGDCGMYGIYVADGGNVILGDAGTKTGPTITTWFAAVGENNTTSPANITIYGGEYTAQAAPADSDWWAYFCAPVYASASGNITISGGTFNGYYGISSRYVNVGQNLNISGGTFNGSNSALFVDTKSGVECSETRTIAITGGTFSSDPGAYVAEGYKAVENGDGTWVVRKKENNAQVGGKNYEELSDAIEASNRIDNTITLTKNTTVKLENGVANGSEKSRNITTKGDGTQTVDVITRAISAEGGMLNYQRGSTFTFENVTVQAGEGDFDGIVCDELTYKDCTIKGKLTLFGKATFTNCVFDNTMANQYSIWTWGGTDVTFEGCTFNTNGKAILLYGGADGKNPTSLVVNNCTFNDRNNGTAGKAAIEIGNDYNATYSLTVTNATVNGFANGKNTNSKLWANKNSMDAAHLSVTIDGTKVL